MTCETPADHGLLIQRLQAIGEETRLSLLQLLSEGEHCVCDLQAELGAGQSLLSFHLKKLKDAGLITDRREGRWIYYRLIPESIAAMRAGLGELESRAHRVGVARENACCKESRPLTASTPRRTSDAISRSQETYE